MERSSDLALNAKAKRIINHGQRPTTKSSNVDIPIHCIGGMVGFLRRLKCVMDGRVIVAAKK